MIHLYVRGWRGMRVEVVLNRQEGVGRGFWGERHDHHLGIKTLLHTEVALIINHKVSFS